MRDARMVKVVMLALVCAGCAQRYAYNFHVRGAPVEDADTVATVRVDPQATAVLLDLRNKTDQVLQVDWANIAIAEPGGVATTLAPDVDLGWIAPGGQVTARLVPIALPREGDAAAANEGRRFDLRVPVIVRRELKVLHYTLVAHVRAI